MKHLILPVLLMVICYFPGQAQNAGKLNTLRTDTSLLQTRLTNRGEDLFLQVEDRSILNGLLEKVEVELQNTDLNLKLQFNKPEGDFRWSLQLGLLPEGGDLFFAPSNLVPNLEDQRLDREGMLKIQWEDLLEDQLSYGQRYQFLLISDLRSTIDCDASKPVFFNAKDQWYHIAGLSASGITLLLGGVIRSDADNDYQQYTSLWEENATFPQAQDLYDTAANKRELSDGLLLGGGILLLIEGYFLRKRYRKVKRERANYDLFCSPQKETNKPIKSQLGFSQAITPQGQLLNIPAYSLTYNF